MRRRPFHGFESVEFCEAAAEAVTLLRVQKERKLVERLIDDATALSNTHSEKRELRLPCARTLAAAVESAEELLWRERIYGRLSEYCSGIREDVSLFEPFAKAAMSLCREYASTTGRLADAERMNKTIRGLARLRGGQTLVRISEPFSFQYELVEDDLRNIRLNLAESDTYLIEPWTSGERFREASQLIDEVARLSRIYRSDSPCFARAPSVSL